MPKPNLRILLIHLLFSIVFLMIRAIQSESITYLFLIWNSILAYIPYLISLYLNSKKHWSLNLIILGFWLLFFPNAPYILTDFVHLHLRPSPDFWFDLIIFFSFAINGLIIGFLSLRRVFRWISQYVSQPIAWIASYSALTMAAFGIYLGRIERWNSWDILLHPFALVKNIYQVLFPVQEQMDVWWFTMLFGLFLMGHYYFFLKLSVRTQKSSHEID